MNTTNVANGGSANSATMDDIKFLSIRNLADRGSYDLDSGTYITTIVNWVVASNGSNDPTHAIIVDNQDYYTSSKNFTNTVQITKEESEGIAADDNRSSSTIETVNLAVRS